MTSGKRTEPDIEATITALVTFGTIPNREQRALEDLMEKVQEVTNRYFYWTKNWPFLAAYRLLTMQLIRCNHIKRVLTELLPKHPLNSANSASFTSNDNSGKPLHQQDPRLKVKRLWTIFPNRRFAAVVEAVTAGAIKVLTLIRRVSNSRCIC